MLKRLKTESDLLEEQRNAGAPDVKAGLEGMPTKGVPALSGLDVEEKQDRLDMEALGVECGDDNNVSVVGAA